MSAASWRATPSLTATLSDFHAAKRAAWGSASRRQAIVRLPRTTIQARSASAPDENARLEGLTAWNVRRAWVWLDRVAAGASKI